VGTSGLSPLLRKIAEGIFDLGFRSVAIPLPGTVDFLGTEYLICRLVLIANSLDLVRKQPHGQQDPHDGQQFRARAGLRHFGSPAGSRYFRRRHLPCRSEQDHDCTARAGAALHGT
jgi:hypothetical protein